MSAQTQEPPQLKLYKGLLVPLFVNVDLLEEMKSFELCSDDIWIVSYPKSGTTWVQQIVKLLQNGCKDDGRKIDQAIPYVDKLSKDPTFHYQVNLSELPFPRAFKSHLTYDLMPCGPPNTKTCKYIYVARNPKDVTVSLHHDLQSRRVYPPHFHCSDFIPIFMKGETVYGNWFDHVLEWWAHKDDPNVLFIKYEDMKKDLSGSVQQIAEFIGCTITKEELEAVVKQSEFESMKSNPLTNYSWKSEGLDKPFMRKGMVGDWKNHFSDEESAMFDTLYTDRMKESGLDFDFA